MPTSELRIRVGRKKDSHEPQRPLILLVIGGHYSKLESLLRDQGYMTVVPATADQAVAICLHNHITAAVIDRVSLVEAEDWSLAKSLKIVSANLPVLLMIPEATSQGADVPEAVDCVVSDRDPAQVVLALKECVRQGAEKRAG